MHSGRHHYFTAMFSRKCFQAHESTSQLLIADIGKTNSSSHFKCLNCHHFVWASKAGTITWVHQTFMCSCWAPEELLQPLSKSRRSGNKPPQTTPSAASCSFSMPNQAKSPCKFPSWQLPAVSALPDQASHHGHIQAAPCSVDAADNAVIPQTPSQQLLAASALPDQASDARLVAGPHLFSQSRGSWWPV